MTVRSVVLSGMSLVERTPVDRRGFMFRETSGATTLRIFLEGGETGRDFLTANLGTVNGKPATSRASLEALINALLSYNCPIYATVDTYLALVFQIGIIKHDQITGVFPWATEKSCQTKPNVTPYTDAICRNVALYYWQLHHHPMIDWQGVVRTFPYSASNTLSYRAKAPYHNIERSLRAKIQPVKPDHLTLQFDWSAAEFNLILQHLGYSPPEDAYGDFVAAGLERDSTKKTVLAYIYGATDRTLYENAGGNALSVNQILGKLNDFYPKVNQWREQCINCRMAEFNGFQYDLGDTEYKRPNHWAQTALQLCKWELLSRLTCAGLHHMGAGDLHDQLYFDVNPLTEADKVAEVIKQVRAPSFGRYNLRPQFKPPAKEWG